MDEHTNNAVDVIEEMSYDVKRALFTGMQSTLRDLPQFTAAELLTDQQLTLFSRPDDVVHEDEMGETFLPNLNEIGFYLEQAEVGLGREEMQRIFLALRNLVDSEGLTRCRLWGKILGIESSYIVAEAEYREGEEDQDSIKEELGEEERELESLKNEAVEVRKNSHVSFPVSSSIAWLHSTWPYSTPHTIYCVSIDSLMAAVMASIPTSSRQHCILCSYSPVLPYGSVSACTQIQTCKINTQRRTPCPPTMISHNSHSF
ncbi:hypothetical protein XENOCAPTIV_005262 [Xenoophorus captivus]|uniref:Uncharacterized protein n=1 Tax=Xenoophorus captivus TaxID=1517983 RepID=A0ABV0QQV9_9TELE